MVIPIYKKEILLSIRGLDPYKGELDTIGGFLENGESPIKGALREFKEETGIKLKKEDLSFLGFYMSDAPYDGVRYEILNIAFVVRFLKKIIPTASDDVTGFVWSSLHKRIKFYHEFINKMRVDVKKSFK